MMSSIDRDFFSFYKFFVRVQLFAQIENDASSYSLFAFADDEVFSSYQWVSSTLLSPHAAKWRLGAKERRVQSSSTYVSSQGSCRPRGESETFSEIKDYMMEHEIYSPKELHDIRITHKAFETWHDRVAYAAVRTLRFFFDTFTGYVHHSSPSDKHKHAPKRIMTEDQWLRRFIFLESIAGVPGMVAGMCRHMKSLRKQGSLVAQPITSVALCQVQCVAIMGGYIRCYPKQRMNVCIC
jgi:hypothetical protein